MTDSKQLTQQVVHTLLSFAIFITLITSSAFHKNGPIYSEQTEGDMITVIQDRPALCDIIKNTMQTKWLKQNSGQMLPTSFQQLSFNQPYPQTTHKFLW